MHDTETTSAFRYVEGAYGGAANRNNVLTVEEFEPNGYPDCYRSVLRFPEAFRAYVTYNHGSVRGYEGEAKADFFAADFDNEDLGRALEDARQAVRRWEALYEVPSEGLRYYFSGSKGFHVEVPESLFGGLEPSRDTAARLGAVAREMLGESKTADLGIYNTTRLWRVPNTRNKKGGMYKIPLYPPEFFNLGVEEIRKLARERRDSFVNTDAGEFEPVPALARLWRESEDAATERRHHKPLDTEAVLGGVPKGQRDRTLFRLACKLRRTDVPQDVAEDVVVKAARNCQPPFSEKEAREKVRATYRRYSPGESFSGDNGGHDGNGGNPEEGPAPLTGAALRTDVGNGERFANRYRGKAMHSAAGGGWLVYDGRRWTRDEDSRVQQLAKQIPHDVWKDASAAFEAGDEDESKAFAKWANESRSATRIDAMLKMARSEPGIPIRAEGLDEDRWLLNCENGTIDLRTGVLREHDPLDRITRLCPVSYDPDAKAPTWQAFLESVLPSEALRGFVQRLAGYWLTGDVSEQILAFFYGTGANGKTTLINTVMAALGDYGQEAAPELLVVKGRTHPTELAELRGRRFVAAVEADADARMAENLVKQLTGGDRIRGRFMRQDFFEFDPTHKVLLAANHKPAVRGTDHAIWRRIKLIPFDVTIPDDKQDKGLPAKLREELPGVLAWAVRGCLDWQREGLGEPDEVKEATKAYRDEMDILGAFIDERCVVHPNASARATALWEAYKTWCEDASEAAELKKSQRDFGKRLGERGFERKKSSVYYWHGIGLAHDGPDDPKGEKRDDQEGTSGSDSQQAGGGEAGGADQRQKGPNAKNGVFAGEPQCAKNSLGPCGPSPDINEDLDSPIGVMSENGPQGPKGPEGPNPKPGVQPEKRRLTPEETERVKRFISQGTKPEIARREVLGEGRKRGGVA